MNANSPQPEQDSAGPTFTPRDTSRVFVVSSVLRKATSWRITFTQS